MAGPISYSIMSDLETGSEAEKITLIPYGCTTLAYFPVPRGMKMISIPNGTNRVKYKIEIIRAAWCRFI